VIDVVDEAIRTLIKRDALDGTDVEVVFDAPNRDWAARQNSPAVDVYLYDIREDMKWRAYGSTDVRDGSSGFVAARHPPRRHFKFSYLVTAWTQRPEDEHRLLSAVLACFLRFDLLPQDVLNGVLDGVKPVSVTIGTPPPDDRSVSDVWTALGGELKPSLDVVVTAPTETGRSFPAGPPVQKPTVLIAQGIDGRPPRETISRHLVIEASTETPPKGSGLTETRIRKRRKQ
jgi:hypothetical protein